MTRVLRNLAKLDASSRRIMGTPWRGYLGSQIPVGSFLYNDLSLPADNDNDYSLRLLTWPSSGSLFLYEDGSGYYIPAADGPYSATAKLVQNGADVGNETLTFNSGVAGVISTTPGNAVASGATATIVQSGATSISTTPGNAVASGAHATVLNSGSVVITTSPGNAVASGAAAIVINGSGLFIPHYQSCVFDGMKNKVVFSGGPYRITF